MTQLPCDLLTQEHVLSARVARSEILRQSIDVSWKSSPSAEFGRAALQFVPGHLLDPCSTLSKPSSSAQRPGHNRQTTMGENMSEHVPRTATLTLSQSPVLPTLPTPSRAQISFEQPSIKLYVVLIVGWAWFMGKGTVIKLYMIKTAETLRLQEAQHLVESGVAALHLIKPGLLSRVLPSGCC